jgi:uncharacterized protein (DUF302 family)
MKHLTEPPLRIVVYTDEDEKWIKRRFIIEQKHWEPLKRILENRQKVTFGEDGSIVYKENK